MAVLRHDADGLVAGTAEAADPPWWEVAISWVYMSFFMLPYVVAAVLWLRDRDEWKAFVRLFVGSSFAALVI